MDPAPLLTWFGLALGGVGALALVLAGSVPVLDDVLADRATLARHAPPLQTDDTATDDTAGDGAARVGDPAPRALGAAA
jgi:hypothetical protein